VKAPFGERINQLKLAQLCSVSWAVALVSKYAVTASVCEAGVAPPATALNVSEEGLTVTTEVGTLIMVSVTRTVCVTEFELIVIRPVHTVPTVNPVWSTETAKGVLVGPARNAPDGVMLSQVLLVQLCSDTWAVALA
jgi:hypothetical protein